MLMNYLNVSCKTVVLIILISTTSMFSLHEHLLSGLKGTNNANL